MMTPPNIVNCTGLVFFFCRLSPPLRSIRADQKFLFGLFFFSGHQKDMTATPRPPGVSLCDLMLQGLLSEGDFLPGGKVDDNVRIRAEVQYASFMTQRDTRSSPPTRLPASRRLPPHATSHGPSTVPISQRPIVIARPQTTRRHRLFTPETIPTPRPPHPSSSSLLPPPPPPLLTQSLGPKACCICQTKEKTHAPLPCFHMCMCESCGIRVDACPLCREPIVSLHRIYT